MKLELLHPITIKALRSSHPWVTRDKFSEKFPKNKKIIELYDREQRKSFGHFIHDPKHPRVVARFWSKEQGEFSELLEKKIKVAFAKKTQLKIERDNYYLCFGEADQLPGLYIQRIGPACLIQYQCFFWESHLPLLIKIIKSLPSFNTLDYWTQQRVMGEEKKPALPNQASNEKEFTINEVESGIKFKLKIDRYYDIGVYSDMAAPRKELIPYFKKANTVLNLFSYTGAFSLMALKYRCKTTSIDLSSHYMNWLEENIELNNFSKENHQSLVRPCDRALTQFQANGTFFDLIICDPPSFSSDKKKRTSALDFYRNELPSLLSCLGQKGKAIIFLNTHKVNASQFKKLVREKMPRNFTIERELKMDEDCTTMNTFPEGDYLKCFILAKK